MLPRLGPVDGLAQDAAVERDVGVDPERQSPLPPGLEARECLAPRVLEHRSLGVPFFHLLHLGQNDLEWDARALENLASPRGSRGEYQHEPGSGGSSASETLRDPRTTGRSRAPQTRRS